MLWKLAIAIVIGYVLIGIFMAFDKERPPLDWKSAQWLPVYLIGMGIISWQGQFSGGAVKSPVNTGHIPFWWDMVIVAAFSLVIYYWARWPPEAVEAGDDEPGRAAGGRAGGRAAPALTRANHPDESAALAPPPSEGAGPAFSCARP